MEDKMRENITNGSIWKRFLYMVMFAIAYSIAEFIIFALVMFQSVSILVVGRANEQLLRFGKNLSVYVYEILEFLTYNTEIHPFPFTPWPDDEHGGDCWLEDRDDVESSEMDQDPSSEESNQSSHEDEQKTGTDGKVTAINKLNIDQKSEGASGAE